MSKKEDNELVVINAIYVLNSFMSEGDAERVWSHKLVEDWQGMPGSLKRGTRHIRTWALKGSWGFDNDKE